MGFKGTVRNGAVILPPEDKLPDGAEVEVIAERYPGSTHGDIRSQPFRDHPAFLNSYAPEDEGLTTMARAGEIWLLGIISESDAIRLKSTWEKEIQLRF